MALPKLGIIKYSMKNLILIGLLLVASHAMAQLSMPQVFGNHMVLQADKPVKLWGQASPNASLTVSYEGKIVMAEAKPDGSWSVELPAMDASSKGIELKVSDGKQVLQFEDILVGEVWFASGQSNMEWPLTKVDLGKETIAAADVPEIRFFQAKNIAAPSPQTDVEGQWKPSNPNTARDFSAVAYFFALKLHRELGVPVGVVQSDWGGKPVETFTRREALLSIPEGRDKMLTQDKAIASYSEAEAKAAYEKAMQAYQKQLEEWNALPENQREGKGPRKPRMARNPGEMAGQPATLWNAMIAPLAGYTMRGAIWYQGESNRRNADEYGALFSLMIEDWREQWGDNFRFLWVQLANFREPVQEPGTNDGWAVVQEHQRRTLAWPKTGMAVINDIGDAKDIHPRNKKDVGERLARWALANDYNKDIIKSGPIYKTHRISKGTVTVEFKHVGEGLESRDGEPLQRFEILGSDGTWHWANAEIQDGQVVISHPEVDEAVAVRYAWAANPEGANLVNSAGLPASLFTTEWTNRVSVPVEGKDLVSYQAGPILEPLGGNDFKGSNFIHPLKTPSGFVLTDSQPKDHLHHFGLWWPWKFIEYDGRKILCWELQRRDGLVKTIDHTPASNGLVAESIYIDRRALGGPEIRINETTGIKVSEIFNVPAHGYHLDLAISQQVAGDKPIKINQFRYSGLGFRATAFWDINNSTLLTSEGANREAANGAAARWIRIEGSNGEGGSAGLLMMGHPDNHNHPEKLRTWNEHYNGAIFVNFNPVMDEPWTFEPGKTYTRQYRLFVYDGELSVEAAEQLWNAYAGN